MDTIGNTINKLRKNRNISKSELARKIDVSPAYITMLENGKKSNPSLEILTKISNVLEIPLDTLVTSPKTKENKFDLFHILEEKAQKKELQSQIKSDNTKESSTKPTAHFTISDMLLISFINSLHHEKPYDKKILDIKNKCDNGEPLSDEDMNIINNNKQRKILESDFDIDTDISVMDYEKESYNLFKKLLISFGYDASVPTPYFFKKIKAQIELEINMNQFKK
ncbi:helix-turn-helix domain-containing protein [Clostridium butyricum]|uniref:Helix-turn-helix transcriptional regulator n=1 Tax=Clostridium butyricum TaxID=1492 RepID=A0AAP9RGE8_CLOBU|nr:helix-turn-helix transcriptional regulator [Clostridium butyricum]MBZ5747013.1 helix-turn-helix transcriptional regulator [Clostridium butyricum]MDI9207896.1 helix-turn-helix transcriptional regulator [Clostridium butyricum]QMW91905.1 helix-turn-helix transcriptional regulator [Clostridium butyricum]BBK75864.1 hypothetical protein Cbu04g_08720 [Clostridium butyricum]GEQ27701.1 hypothetical protein CBU03nite_41240 [Clostridium butyricum]